MMAAGKNLNRFLPLLFNPAVKGRKKLFLVMAVLFYWLLPADLFPFMPLDDLLFTMLAAWLFTGSASKDVAGSPGKQDAQDFIDVQAHADDEG